MRSAGHLIMIRFSAVKLHATNLQSVPVLTSDQNDILVLMRTMHVRLNTITLFSNRIPIENILQMICI